MGSLQTKQASKNCHKSSVVVFFVCSTFISWFSMHNCTFIPAYSCTCWASFGISIHPYLWLFRCSLRCMCSVCLFHQGHSYHIHRECYRHNAANHEDLVLTFWPQGMWLVLKTIIFIPINLTFIFHDPCKIFIDNFSKASFGIQ